MRMRALLIATAIAGALLVTSATAAVAAPAPRAATADVGTLGCCRNYYITVKTGNMDGAGTDANVYLVVNGRRVQLDDNRDNFERAKTETFGPFQLDQLEVANWAALEKDGSGSAWFVEWFKITDRELLIESRFVVNRWFGGGIDGGRFHDGPGPYPI